MTSVSYSRDDFASKADIRWCPGCGDYAILAAVQKTLAELGLPPEKHVFVSGIGCSGRLPYYMNTYGYHTIHGRALPVATGIKALRDDLSVWVITGDGDSLSIGGNHLIHCLRRNVNVNILLVNNQVYGLTKGQFSPTSQPGQITKTSPSGVDIQPINPLALALAAGASFVARAVDKDPVHLSDVLKQAYAHRGCTFIEINQDCHIFNAGAFDDFSTKNRRVDRTVSLEAGKPLLFGKDLNHGLIWHDDEWHQAAAEEASSYCHDPAKIEAATRLVHLDPQRFPIPLGVYYQHNRSVFKFPRQCSKTVTDLDALFRSKNTWKIHKEV